jgi:hypothetical protein
MELVAMPSPSHLWRPHTARAEQPKDESIVIGIDVVIGTTRGGTGWDRSVSTKHDTERVRMAREMIDATERPN